MIFCDIDGTLTTEPHKMWGPVIPERLEALRRMCAREKVVLWTGGGERYARRFADYHEIPAFACLGKPTKLFDDNPEIRPNGLGQYVAHPKELR